MKNCQTFYESQTVSHLQEITQPSPNPPTSDKTLLRLWKKIYRDTEIYRDIQTFAFKVLQKSSSWVSRNGAVQIFSLTSSRNMSERLLGVLQEHIVFNVK